MNKILITLLLLLFFVGGCSAKKDHNNSNTFVKQSDIKGYWLQIEENLNGNIRNLKDNKNYYLEITDDKLMFYSYYSDTESHAVSNKYYKLEDNKIYYDYYELKDKDWKDNINELYGGVYEVSYNTNKLILTKKLSDNSYEESTYEKVDAKDWPIGE